MPVKRRALVQPTEAVGDETSLATTSSALTSQQEPATAPRSFRELVPEQAQFPLVVAASFAMASLGYSVLGELTGAELATVSRSQDTWGEIAVLAGWRV